VSNVTAKLVPGESGPELQRPSLLIVVWLRRPVLLLVQRTLSPP
jgi:hypothetical protein